MGSKPTYQNIGGGIVLFYRSKFVTNSSSTSLVAFGVEIDRRDFEELMDSLPKGVDYKYNPDECVYIHIGFPDIGIDKDGELVLPDKEVMKEKYLALNSWLKEHGIDQEIGYIEEGWYNG